jgi:hypothetical protein
MIASEINHRSTTWLANSNSERLKFHIPQHCPARVAGEALEPQAFVMGGWSANKKLTMLPLSSGLPVRTKPLARRTLPRG